MHKVVTESRLCPPAVQARIRRAGGVNLFGQPNFRLVWGWNRLQKIQGFWDQLDSDDCYCGSTFGWREVPRYPEFFKWHLEKWVPAGYYGAERAWYETAREVEQGRTFVTMPYPYQGDYEHCFTLQDSKLRYVPLTPSVVERVVQAVIASRYLVHRDKVKAREALVTDIVRKGRRWESRMDDTIDEAFDMMKGSKPMVTVPTPI